MKKSNYFLLMLISISYSSILESDLIYFNNKFYSPNSHIPYSGKVVDYYSNKLISYEGTYLNGLKDGEFNYYYESGSIHKKEVYNLGNSSGLWIEYDKNGSIVNKKLYDKRGYIYTSFYENLVVKSTGRYIKNEKVGFWVDYFENGNKKKESYYENGFLDTSRTIIFESNLDTISLQDYKPLEHNILIRDSIKIKEILNGEYISYYKNGNMLTKKYYIDNLLDGEQYEFYDSGRLFRSRVYTKGSIDTSSYTIEYYEQGPILSKYYESLENSVPFKQGMFTSYHLNGLKLLEGKYNLDKKVGSWKEYYDSGTILSELNYDNLTLDNTLKINFYDSSGQLLIEADIKSIDENCFHGNYLKYYNTGEIFQSGFYIDNIKEGLWQEFYKSGSILSKINYVNHTGIFYSYFESGEIQSEGYYINGKKNGKWTEYYKNGNVKNILEYFNGTIEVNKPLLTYTSNGELLSKAFIKISNDEIVNDGLFFEYFPSGQIKSRGLYSYGNKSGEWLDFYESGLLYSKLNLENGNGEYKSFYPSGGNLLTGKYKNYKKEGKWTKFYKNGYKSWEYYYVNDVLDPNQICYNWYESGYKRSEGYLIINDDILEWDGNYKEFFENGVIYLSGEYFKGKKIGNWKQFYSNRSLHSEKKYNEGIPSGEWIFYNEYGKVVKVENY